MLKEWLATDTDEIDWVAWVRRILNRKNESFDELFPPEIGIDWITILEDHKIKVEGEVTIVQWERLVPERIKPTRKLSCPDFEYAWSKTSVFYELKHFPNGLPSTNVQVNVLSADPSWIDTRPSIDLNLTSASETYSEIDSEGERIIRHRKKDEVMNLDDTVEISSDGEGEEEEEENQEIKIVEEEVKKRKRKKFKPFKMEKLE